MASGIVTQEVSRQAVGPALAAAFATADVWFAEQRQLFDWSGPDSSDLQAMVAELLYHNFQVWHYEDLGRSDADASILIGWRGAMRHNQHRNQLINAIDALHSARHRPDAPLHSESLGALVDRLTILYLKHKNYLLRCTATAAAVRAQLDELCIYAADLQTRLLSGQVRCPQVPRLKLYLPVAAATPSAGSGG